MTGNKLEVLERTVLELGAELFRLKTELTDVKNFHNHFVSTLKGLKELFDEKGMIHSEDFEAAIELGNALAIEKAQGDPAFEVELEN